jgi:hypothetical protein
MSTNQAEGEHVNTRRIWLAGLVGIVASIIANLVVRALLFAVLPLPGDFPPLQPGSLVVFTAVGTFLAAVVFAVIARFSSRPVSTFRIVAIIALVVSVLPNLALMANPEAAPFPGGNALAFGSLVVFHVVAALVSFLALTRLTRE